MPVRNSEPVTEVEKVILTPPVSFVTVLVSHGEDPVCGAAPVKTLSYEIVSALAGTESASIAVASPATPKNFLETIIFFSKRNLVGTVRLPVRNAGLTWKEQAACQRS
jgi:hypothetical protein